MKARTQRTRLSPAPALRRGAALRVLPLSPPSGERDGVRGPAAPSRLVVSLAPVVATPELVPSAGSPLLALTAPVVAVTATEPAATETKSFAPPAASQLLTETTHLPTAITQVPPATLDMRAATLPAPKPAAARPAELGSTGPERTSGASAVAGPLESLWRRATPGALDSHPAAGVRRCGFPFPVAGAWQQQRLCVSPAVRFGGVVERRAKPLLAVRLATGFFRRELAPNPVRQPC